jgi:hypothetical protein
MFIWSKDAIAQEILCRYHAQQDLSYSGMSRENLPLLRAAVRHFGSWQAAIEFAGLNYEEIRKYKVWTKEGILNRIREMHAQGEDLSWGHVSLRLDPALAAAAVKKHHFGSWQEAVEQAGLDYEQIRRYQEWNSEKVLNQVHELYAQGERLNAKQMERQDVRLLTAARRRFYSWDRALSEAGLDSHRIMIRAPYRRRNLSEHQANS